MKRLLLHIGLPKTGSTAIQRFLKLNHASGTLPGGTGYDPDLGLALVRHIRHHAELELGAYEECDTIIASSEMLSSQLVNVGPISKCKEILSRRFDEVKVYAYVRRQDDVLVSSYYTSVLRGTFEPFSKFSLKNPKFHGASLRSWNEIFGRGNVVVRRYGKEFLQGLDILHDFCWALGLDSQTLTFPMPANVSPSLEVIEFVRRVGRMLGDHPDKRQILKSIGQAGPRGTPLGLARKRRLEVLEAFAEVNAELSDTFFNGEALFSSDLPDDGLEEPVLNVGTIAKITNTVLRHFELDTQSFRDLSSKNEAYVRAVRALEALAAV